MGVNKHRSQEFEVFDPSPYNTAWQAWLVFQFLEGSSRCMVPSTCWNNMTYWHVKHELTELTDLNHIPKPEACLTSTNKQKTHMSSLFLVAPHCHWFPVASPSSPSSSLNIKLPCLSAMRKNGTPRWDENWVWISQIFSKISMAKVETDPDVVCH